MRADLFDEILVYMNPHWQRDYSYGYDLKRFLFPMLARKDDHWISLIMGPRRVGKTILMKQLIDYFISKSVPRERILYLLLENESISIKDSVIAWIKRFGISQRNKFYLFVDEVQYNKNWASEVKLLYDIFPNVRIFLSGSASSLIKSKTGPLAGRMSEYYLGPLSFSEWMSFTGNRHVDDEDLLWSYYETYLFQQLPELTKTSVSPIDYIKSIVNKVILDDLNKLFSAVDEDFAYALLRIIYRQPGQMLEYHQLANELGVYRETVSKYLYALESAFLVRKLYSYSGSTLKSERRKKKFYPFYTSLLHYVGPNYPSLSYILETDVAEKLNAQFYYYDRGKEIDFVLPQKKIAVEVKAGRRVICSDLTTLLNESRFLRKYVVAPPYTSVECDGVVHLLPWRLEGPSYKHAV